MEGGGANWIIVTKEKRSVKAIKKAAEDNGIYDKTRLITYSPEDDVYALPVSSNSTQLLNYQPTELPTQYDITNPAHFQGCRLIRDSIRCGRSKVKRKTDVISEMQSIVNRLSADNGHSKYETEVLLKSLPTTWMQHGDMIVLPGAEFRSPLWEGLIASAGRGLWEGLSHVLNCNKIALHEKIADDKFRTPVTRLVLGEDGWVSHTDNGVCYVFDVTRTMFSQGNISEKIRMGRIDCKDEVIVDLFTGIGYFTLQVLVHGKAQCVYACEWNPWAVEGLKRGLSRNRVSDRCIVLHGDNRKVAPRGVADRVILGLVPSSEGSWETGCTCIKPDKGGWLHIHGNVTTCLKEERRNDNNGNLTIDKDRETVDDSIQVDQAIANISCLDLLKRSSHDWSEYTRRKIAEIFNRMHSDPSGSGNETRWSVCIRHIEHVKSYAPHVHHVVVDLECRPYSV